MSESIKRGVFSLDGVTGMLIATVLLLSILAGLTMWGIVVQQKSASNYYDPAPIVGNLDNVQSNSKNNAQHAFVDAK